MWVCMTERRPPRWIINFFDWPLNRQSAPVDYTGPVASDYPDCLAVVRDRVKPERDRLGLKADASAKGYAKWWWQYGRKGLDLYKSIAGLGRVLVKAQVSKTWAWEFLPNGWVYDAKLIVTAYEEWDAFSVLQSTLHWEFSILYGTTLRLDMSYTPTTNFEPFPFPTTGRLLTEVGEHYHTHRISIIRNRSEGLTKTYNRFHSSDEAAKDIQTLRDLHVEMDKAVAAAYGWSDLDLGHGFHETRQGIRFTISESARRETLARLLKLNHERYAEEVAQGLHDKKRGKRSKRGRRKKASESNNSSQADLFGDLL